MELSYLEKRRQMKQGLRAADPSKSAEKAKIKEAENKKLFAADKDFYAEIWAVSAHKCQECGKKLGKEPLTLFFHHLLPKAIYPQFRHTPENIMILCPDHHSQAETDLDKVPKVKARRDEVVKMLLV